MEVAWLQRIVKIVNLPLIGFSQAMLSFCLQFQQIEYTCVSIAVFQVLKMFVERLVSHFRRPSYVCFFFDTELFPKDWQSPRNLHEWSLFFTVLNDLLFLKEISCVTLIVNTSIVETSACSFAHSSADKCHSKPLSIKLCRVLVDKSLDERSKPIVSDRLCAERFEEV